MSRSPPIAGGPARARARAKERRLRVDVCKEVLPEVPMTELAVPVMMPLMTRFLIEHPEYATLNAPPPANTQTAVATAV
jgi:hypothetical protein